MLSDSGIGRDFLAVLANPDDDALRRFYAETAVLHTPLDGARVGLGEIGRYFRDLHAGFPGLRVALHDEFTSADGSRAVIRVQLEWRNAGAFRGHPATGRGGVMPETHTFTVTDGRVTRHVVGASGFQLPQLFLAEWSMDFPRENFGDAEILSRAPGNRR